MLVAAFCALAAGAVETGIVAFQQVVLRRITFVGPDFVWMTPAACLLLVVPAALLVHGVTAVVRRPLSPASLLGLLAAVLAFAISLRYAPVAWWASALLAVGAGARIARSAARAGTGLLPALRLSALVLAAAMAAAGIGVRASRAATRARAAARLPNPSPGAPNVLLIVLDTVRASSMSVYGNERPTTPRLREWAEESVVFERAITTAPWTLPAHSSLFTGRDARDIECGWKTPLSSSPRTLAEALGAHGYASAAFVANLAYASYESGLDRGFVHYDDYRVSLRLLLPHPALTHVRLKSNLPQARSLRGAVIGLSGTHLAVGGLQPADDFRPADRIAQAFLDWQAGTAERPFFAFLNLFDAHGPYRAPRETARRFARAAGSKIDRYEAAIAWTDQVVGGVLDALRQRGVLDRTIVVITSDHGEQFGEHGYGDHANTLYMPLLHVPLMIRYPTGVPAGRRVEGLVSLRDVPATILELAGLQDPGIAGTSLSRTWLEGGPALDGDVVAYLAKGIRVSVKSRHHSGDAVARLDGRFHYVRNGDGSEELFDYHADPDELRNLAGDPDRRSDLERLRTGLLPRWGMGGSR